MLAYNGLALITEKLQNQRLEETGGGGAGVQQTSGSTTVTSAGGLLSSLYGSTSAGSSCSSMGSTSLATKLPQVTSDSTAKNPQSNLAVKGKNVWASSLESERIARRECSTPETKTYLRLPDSKAPASPQIPTVCWHRKLRHLCPLCDMAPGTPTAPPKKKHCRSLSVPPDGGPPTSSSSTLPSPGRDGGGKLLRPIAVIPLGSRFGGSLQDEDHEDSDDCPDRFANSSPALFATTTNASFRDILTTTSSTGGSKGSNSKWLPRLSTGSFVKLVPSPTSTTSVPSPPSVDSGHFTTSDLQTPPGSPVPQRPASAASDTSSSFSSLGSAWHEFSPLRAGGRHSASFRARVLENRSLSMEDRISGASSTASIPGGFEPCLRCRSSSSNDESGGGMLCGATGGNGESGGRIPRCHSQPCVLHHRRCGKKRRRDCDRPTLNFNKMTETAYSRSHRRSEPWNTSTMEHQMWPSHRQDFIDIVPNSRSASILNTIASSPLDSADLPSLVAQQAANSRLTLGTDLSQAASIALPLTPPDQKSPNFLSTPERRDEEEEEEEEVEEETDHTDCSCHDGRTDDSVGLFPLADLDLEQIENH